MASTLKVELRFLETTDPDTGEEKPDLAAFRLTCQGTTATLVMFAEAFAKAVARGGANIVLHGPDPVGEVEKVDEADAPAGMKSPEPPAMHQETPDEATGPK